MWIAIVAFIILLVILVIAHEFGHFILSKAAGVKVYEFAVGMGPKLFSWNKPKKGAALLRGQEKLIGEAREKALAEAEEKESHKTEFSFRMFPIGGFVSIKGETPAEKGATIDKDSLLQAPFWWKIAILLGGVVMNVIVAWILFTIGFTQGFKPIQVLPDNILNVQSRSYLMPSHSFLEEKGLLSGQTLLEPAKILSVAPDGLADQLGMQEGDRIIMVDGVSITSINIQTELKKHIGKAFDVQYAHNGETKTATAECPQDSCFFGVLLDTTSTVEVKNIKFGLLDSMKAAGQEVREQSRLTFVSLANIFGAIGDENSGDIGDKLSGPVAAAKIAEMVLEAGGWKLFLMFGGMLSMALAIFNILPIPALDGGRILGVIIQKVFRLKSEKYYTVEGWINTIFFILLMVLAVYLLFNDLVKAWGVKIPFLG